MTEQNEPRDLWRTWPVIDGPIEGELMACLDNYFDVLVDPRDLPRAPGSGAPVCMRYYLRALEGGGYVWSCAALA